MRYLTAVGLLSTFTFSFSMAVAQTANSAGVSGTITDSSGAALPGAMVKLTNQETSASRSQLASSEGQYTFSNVAPGLYTVTALKEGFQSAEGKDHQFSVSNSYTVDLHLTVGQSVTTVEVVAESATTELQTTDAQIGNVVQQQQLVRLPTLTRNAFELLALQPGATPAPASGDNFGRTGGGVSGARVDQNAMSLDGLDITDTYFAGSGFGPVFPLGVESVSEFRVGVGVANTSFGRAPGAQVTVTSRSGTNAIHGAAYWFNQNSIFNANTWDNNRLGLARPAIRDNRAGISLGGPLRKDRTFLFGNVEPRRFFQTILASRTVPSESLKNGIITLAGRTYNLATAAACGPNGNLPCDPRGLGISPSVRALWNLMPAGNDTTSGDGVNYIGYRFNAPAPLRDNSVAVRLDHIITPNLNFFSRYQYAKTVNANGNVNVAQLDLRNNSIISNAVIIGDGATAGLDWVAKSNVVNSLRFGWIRSRVDFNTVKPSIVAADYNIPGTASDAGPVIIAPAMGGFTSGGLISQPIDLDGQRARRSRFYTKNIQVRDDVTWIRGSKTLSAGINIQFLPMYMDNDDKLTGYRNSVAASLDANVQLFLTPESRPPGLSAANQTIWDRLYASSLGLIDSTAVMVVRDANLNPLPIGTPVSVDTMMRSYYGYVNETWRVTPTFTLTYGLGYGWQSAPTEKQGRMMTLTYAGSGERVSSAEYLRTLESEAQAGRTFTPTLAYTPYKQAGLSGLWKTDYGNLSPRVSFSWNPALESGFLTKFLGKKKTVFRGGFGMAYDRVSNVVPGFTTLGEGFSQIYTLARPSCNATGTGGAGCGVNTTPAGAVFRVGVDGQIPLPPPDQPQRIPYVAPEGQGQWSYVVDPDFKVGRNYLFDFSIQRELPGNMLLEAAYIGRMGRRLQLGSFLTQAPYMFRDTASGQTFAEAFDSSAGAMRQGTALANLPEQPFFANQFPALGRSALCPGAMNNTQCVISQAGSAFVNGDISRVFNVMDSIRSANGRAAYANHQATGLEVHDHVGISNYNAFTLTLQTRGWRGAVFQANYTYSKSLDMEGSSAWNLTGYSNSIDQYSSYGPSGFDRTHIFNALFSYDLPFGKGALRSSRSWLNRAIGGWYLSGVLQASSGLPLTVNQGTAFGGSITGTSSVPAVPLNSDIATRVNSDVRGASGVGTTGDPARRGSGLNLFDDPASAFSNFRHIRLSADTRSGRANPLRGLPFLNQDLRVSKDTFLYGERVKAEFSADFFNILNSVNFSAPSLSLTSPATFGVISSQLIPGNRLNGSRWIQLGLRIAF